MRDEIQALNGFVETLSRESSAFDFPSRGKKLVLDRQVSRALALVVLRGTPSERFADMLFPFLNLADDERLICAQAALRLDGARASPRRWRSWLAGMVNTTASWMCSMRQSSTAPSPPTHPGAETTARCTATLR